MQIPFLDLKAQYVSIKEEIDNAIFEIMENASFVGGSLIAKFEEEFAEYLGINHCISVANGTDALEIGLQTMEVSEDDEVIVPAISWISTSEAVSNVGAKPVFVDIHPDTYTINPRQIENKIGPKTKAIIPVHLYGHPADMPAIMSIARKYGLKVLEDCAQAHGASINGQMTGTFGDMASFSFYPSKNLGAYGDAGSLTTNNTHYAEKARMISNHGQLVKHSHRMEGRNSRMDAIQAAVLSVKLKYLNDWTKKRISRAQLYNRYLKGLDILEPKVKDGYKHVYHLYVIKLKNRDKIKEGLLSHNIGAAIHYPKALPFLEVYDGYDTKGFSVAHKFQNEILSLPMFPELSDEAVVKVCETLKKLLN